MRAKAAEEEAAAAARDAALNARLASVEEALLKLVRRNESH